MSQVRSGTILVIGGGIGGLTAALSMAKAGRSVTVLEQAPQFSEIGAGLQLAPNAMRVLDKLGLSPAIADVAWFPQRLVLKDAQTARELAALNLGEAFLSRYGFPYAVMHRADLHQLLYDACQRSGRVQLAADKRVLSVQDGGDWAEARCQDDTVYRADAVIAADGLWSHTRRLLSADNPVSAEYVAYRGAIPMAEMREYARMDDVVMWIGPEVHFVQYPVRRGELYNQVAVFRSHQYTAAGDDWGTPSELDQAFSRSCPQVQHAVTFMHRERRWEMLDRLPIHNWVTGRVALLGDAAHPMLQYIAQGACQAIEDGACLGDKFLTCKDDVARVLAAYASERVERTARVQTAARTFGQVIHTADATAALLRDHLLARRTADDVAAVDWLYSHDAAPHL